VHFIHLGKGLVSKDGQPLTGFTAAGDDGIFYPADAAISGDAVVVTSSQVKEPKESGSIGTRRPCPIFTTRTACPPRRFAPTVCPRKPCRRARRRTAPL